MQSLHSAILMTGFFALVSFGALIYAGNSHSFAMGCLILGSEVNGNNSVEYLGIGHC